MSGNHGSTLLSSDNWGKRRENPASLPQKAKPILALQVVEQGFGFDLILYFFRAEKSDELWILSMGEDGLYKDYESLAKGGKHLDEFRTSEFDAPYCCLTIPRQTSEHGSCYRLLHQYCRAVIPFNVPARFIAPGVLSKDLYDAVIGSIQDEIESNRREAVERKSEIIDTARELGLNIEPPFLSRGIWSATCPGTHHHLYLSSKTNTYGCGYCGRKGGSVDLISFVEERKENKN